MNTGRLTRGPAPRPHPPRPVHRDEAGAFLSQGRLGSVRKSS